MDVETEVCAECGNEVAIDDGLFCEAWECDEFLCQACLRDWDRVPAGGWVRAGSRLFCPDCFDDILKVYDARPSFVRMIRNYDLDGLIGFMVESWNDNFLFRSFLDFVRKYRRIDEEEERRLCIVAAHLVKTVVNADDRKTLRLAVTERKVELPRLYSIVKDL